jgi:very-short-patch-repair endonuclease
MPTSEYELLKRAKATRHDMSPLEAHLWYRLRDRRLNGIKFNRGCLVEGYIGDFVARTPKLVIELDGDTHAGHERYDAQRTRALEAKGYRVLRFSNADVMGNVEGVLEMIVAAVADIPSPRPSPRERGEGEE